MLEDGTDDADGGEGEQDLRGSKEKLRHPVLLHWVPPNPYRIRKEPADRERSRAPGSRTESVRRVGTGGSTEPPGARGQAQKGRRQDPRCCEKVTVRSMSLGGGEEERCHRDGAPNSCLCTIPTEKGLAPGVTYSRATPQLAEQREAASL